LKSKKKVLYHSNHSKLLSGFGKHAKNMLQYLSLTDKYEIVEFSNGVSEGHEKLKNMPWKTIGALPSDKESLDRINKDPNLNRSAAYGALSIDKVIKNEKPDVYIGVEDIWGLSGYTSKTWWNKINCMLWTTLDSIPILPEAVKCAKKVKNYFVWASFAEKAMKDLGHNHVKTLRGSVKTEDFFKLKPEDKKELRDRFGLANEFVIGFVFRNQLRKSVPNMLDGFKLFKSENPSSNAKLLLHTNWAEGWDIARLIKEKDINSSDILCTYYCPKCGNYDIRPFSSQGIDCRFCGAEKSLKTITITEGVSEDQLNEIYNLMDVYCHPFTSGGMEIPIFEAKLTELITLVTDYSCGKDSCTSDSGGFPLDWAEYREPGTQFIKATTYPSSISKQLNKVYKMQDSKKIKLGKKARDFVVNNYSVEVIGKQLEKIIDSMPEIDYDFSFEETKRDPNYIPKEIKDDSDWLIDIYKNILKIDVDRADEGHQYWMKILQKGDSRDSVISYFRDTAIKENNSNDSSRVVDFDEIIKNEGNPKALFVLNGEEEDIFLSTALLKDFKNNNPGYDLFFACNPKYHLIISSNPYIYRAIPYSPQMENEFLMMSASENPYFDYYCNLGILTKNQPNYHGIKNFSFNLHE
jgi:glycosyltransferase involved in cell wall biosynthesis